MHAVSAAHIGQASLRGPQNGLSKVPAPEKVPVSLVRRMTNEPQSSQKPVRVPPLAYPGEILALEAEVPFRVKDPAWAFHGHRLLVQTACNHPGRNEDVCVPLFGSHTSETAYPKELEFPREPHVGRKRLKSSASQKKNLSPWGDSYSSDDFSDHLEEERGGQTMMGC